MEINNIYCGDCAEVMKSFPDNCITSVITSPPYDSLRTYNTYSFEFEVIARELYRIIMTGGVLTWVCNDATVGGSRTGTSFIQTLYFKELGFLLHEIIIWQKSGSSYPAKGRYTPIYDFMMVLSKGKPKTFNPIKDIPRMWQGSWGKLTVRQKDGSLIDRNLKNEGKAKSGRDDTGKYGYKQRTNIWTIKNGQGFNTRDSIAKNHPAIFPETLAADCIYTWTNIGDIVLDPFCGSGTVAKMSVLMGRNFIGIDINKEYCDISNSRIELARNLILQPNFVPYDPHTGLKEPEKSVIEEVKPLEIEKPNISSQPHRRERNKLYEYEGIKLTLKQWSKEVGISYNTLYQRLHTLDWTLEEALVIQK